MKIEVPFLENLAGTNIKNPTQANFSMHKIDHSPWEKKRIYPEVSFTIAHSSNAIIIRYFVTEEEIRAMYLHHNDPVYKDSCVEFFIAFEDDENYYNLEFNCLGTCLAGYGPNVQSRELLPVELIAKIDTYTTIDRSQGGQTTPINWQLSMSIPIELFKFHKIEQLNGMTARANFYKCGDDLKSPHYLCWNKIKHPKPNFHLPKFFGELKFL